MNRRSFLHCFGIAPVTVAGVSVLPASAAEPIVTAVVDGESDGELWHTEFPPFKRLNAVDTTTVHATALGAVEASVITSALQAAINFCMYGGPSLGSKPAKTLIDLQHGTLDDTLHIGYGTSFKGGHLEGLGAAYAGEAHNNVGTALTSTVPDRPAIAIQGARNTRCIELALVGPARDAIRNIDFYDADQATDEAVWDAALTSAGITPGRRYAPHAGVAIDPYSGTAPDPAYPAVNYPSFLGAVDQYGKNYSSNVKVRALIQGFEIGIANQPCDADGNGDFTELQDCFISDCKYGVSIGNSQARVTDLRRVNFNRVHTCLTNNKHGKQRGKFGGHVTNLHGAGFIYQIFEFNRMAWAGPLRLSGVYFESLFKIGHFTAPATTGVAMSFANSFFNFKLFNNEAVPAAVLSGDANDAIEFSGCHFKPLRVVAFTPIDVRITDGSMCDPYEQPTKPYEALAFNCLMGGFATNPRSGVRHSATMNVRSAATAEKVATVMCDESFRHTGRDTCIPHALAAGRCSVAGSWTGKKTGYAGVFGSRLSVGRSGRTITAMFSASNVDSFYREGRLPGCVMIHDATGTVMFVRSVDTTTGETILEMQNNYIADGSGGFDIFNQNFDPETGNWYSLNGLVYSPERMLWGTLTEGSNVITNVRSAGGVDAAGYGLTVGDRLADEFYEDAPFTGSVALEIMGVDSAAKTITLAGNARFSATHYPLPWWYRQPPANEASR